VSARGANPRPRASGSIQYDPWDNDFTGTIHKIVITLTDQTHRAHAGATAHLEHE
jgi:hypothetical protein